MRNFDIEIYRYGEWHITLNGFDIHGAKRFFKFKNKELVLPAQVADENNKIAYIFDAFIDDKTIGLAQNEPLMSEVCEFAHEKYKFQGTFIDALNYIKDNFKA